MKIFNSFNNRQYQLSVCSKAKHRSLKSRKVNDLFVGKIAYNPMMFRNTCRYPIENRRKSECRLRYWKKFSIRILDKYFLTSITKLTIN